jgi:isopenicillin N synthase-like dioxygenase
MDISLIDLTPCFDSDRAARERLAVEVDRACRDTGFLVVTGHRVDPSLLDALRRDALSFFDLPADRKHACEAVPGSDFAGYVRSEALSYSRGDASPPDLKESYTVHPPGRPGRVNPTPWPVDVPTFERTLTDYFAVMEALAARVMRVFALALSLDEQHFDPVIDQSLSAVRMLHYPPLDAPPEPGQLRAGAHTDFGSLTLLLTDDAPGGLQVLAGERWIDVPHVPGSFVVNIGDLMAQWTNDRWVSTLHRVVPPPVGPGTRRLSVAFFHQPNDDALIETLPTCREPGVPDRYPPVRSGDHLRLKVRRQRDMRV